MKAFLKNLKPFISYWASFAIYFIFPFFGLTELSTFWFVLPLILICIFNFITGYIDGFNKIRWGVLLFALQLTVFGILQLLLVDVDSRVIVFGNLINSNVLPYIFYMVNSTLVDIIFMICSILLPIVPFFIGNRIKKYCKQNQDK